MMMSRSPGKAWKVKGWRLAAGLAGGAFAAGGLITLDGERIVTGAASLRSQQQSHYARAGQIRVGDEAYWIGLAGRAEPVALSASVGSGSARSGSPHKIGDKLSIGAPGAETVYVVIAVMPFGGPLHDASIGSAHIVTLEAASQPPAGVSKVLRLVTGQEVPALPPGAKPEPEPTDSATWRPKGQI